MVDEGEGEKAVRYRSVSQYNDYRKCPHMYYLKRMLKAWSRPAAWLPQGTAVHKAVEEWEKSGRTLSLEQTQEVYRDEYVNVANEMLTEVPNMEYWFDSGPYDGETDLERRFEIGLQQVEKVLRFLSQQKDEVIWVDPDGNPGIELEFTLELDGILVRGFIDRVTRKRDVLTELSVDDLKTGNEPGDEFQPGTYKVALEEKYPGITVVRGGYLMAGKKNVKNSRYIEADISHFNKEMLTKEYHWLDENIKAERFDPDPEPSKCMFCSVRTACEFSQA